MAIDVRDHEAVPKHEIMDEEEVDELLETFDTEKDKLPKIERTDAALKQMGVEAGDIIHVERESPTAGKTDYYRLVVDR